MRWWWAIVVSIACAVAMAFAQPTGAPAPGSGAAPAPADGSATADTTAGSADPTPDAITGGDGSATGSADPATEVEPTPPTPTPEPEPVVPSQAAASSQTDTSSPTSPLVSIEPPAGAPEQSTSEGTLVAIKVIIGLIVLAVLAYLGGHRRVVRFQERLGISGVITAGFPFVALGLIAAQPSVGILGPEVIDRMRPILHFGLGWLGFIIGAQLDIRVLDRVPKGTAYLILVESMGPFALTAAGCGAVMIAFGLSWKDPAVWRDVILLGAAAAMTAPRKFRGFANRTWHEGRGVDILLSQLDELVGVIGLLFITAYFRETGETAWQIPSTAWVFVSLGLGVAIGVLIFAMVRVPKSNAEFLAVVLGGIAFASGLAGFLHLSPIVVCFLAGVLVTNFPNDQRDSIFRILNHLERPVHMLFLIVAGAVWDVADWRGWVIMPLFVVGRVVGKYAGVFASRTAVGTLLPAGFADQRQLVMPMSSLSIALVISVASLYSDTGLTWAVTAVLGGAILNELLVQATARDEGTVRAPIDELEHSAPIDELVDDEASSGAMDGPIYRDEPPGPPDRGGGAP